MPLSSDTHALVLREELFAVCGYLYTMRVQATMTQERAYSNELNLIAGRIADNMIQDAETLAKEQPLPAGMELANEAEVVRRYRVGTPVQRRELAEAVGGPERLLDILLRHRE